MQAIRTRYVAPTSYKGAKIAATCAAGSKSIPWNDALSNEENHNAARKALCAKLEWSGEMVSGTFTDGCMYHVFTGV